MKHQGRIWLSEAQAATSERKFRRKLNPSVVIDGVRLRSGGVVVLGRSWCGPELVHYGVALVAVFEMRQDCWRFYILTLDAAAALAAGKVDRAIAAADARFSARGKRTFGHLAAAHSLLFTSLKREDAATIVPLLSNPFVTEAALRGDAA